MARRFQFSLRRLLAAVVLLCFALGAWHVYVTYFASFVEIAPTPVGRAIQVHGRFCTIGGKGSTVINVQIRPIGKDVIAQSASTIVQKTGRTTYEFDIGLPPIDRAGEYEATVESHSGLVAKRKLTITPTRTIEP